MSTVKNKGENMDISGEDSTQNTIGKTIGVLSGKGGVGKSLVCGLSAVSVARRGYRCAILDADITGPSIPRMFGIRDKAVATPIGILPNRTADGIDVMSVNLLLDDDEEPVVWRGPIITNTVRQFYNEVIWGEEDYMFIDMPPGTGDVPLTVFQSIPLSGIVIVTSPQELVGMIVAKALNMAEMMAISVIGIVENMRYFHCPDNGLDYKIFGDSHVDEIADKHGLSVIAKIPIEPELATACDRGAIEGVDYAFMGDLADAITKF
jgi:Mrp family chromosome partitioning ATPase